MKASERTADPTRDLDGRVGPPELEQPPSRRLKVVILVGVVLVAGFVGRSLVGDDAVDNPLVSWLPWLNQSHVTLYFGDESGEYLVPVSRTFSRRSEPSALVAALLEGPAPGTGLVSLLPEGTGPRTIAHAESVLVVDLVGDAERLGAPLVRAALRHSLASWPGVDEVQVTVAGVPLGGVAVPAHLLYFYDESRGMLVAQPAVGDGPREILAQYLAGPKDANLTGLPADVELLSLDLRRESGLLAVDFTYLPSMRRYAVDHPDATRRVLEGLIATLTEGFPEIDAVWLDFEGHEALGVGQCADLLRTAQTQPRTLNDERLLKRRAGG